MLPSLGNLYLICFGFQPGILFLAINFLFKGDFKWSNSSSSEPPIPPINSSNGISSLLVSKSTLNPLLNILNLTKKCKIKEKIGYM